MVWKPPRAYFLPKSNYQKNFQLKIPILRKIDCSAIYAHAMMGLIFIWDLLVMCPGAKNRFWFSGGIRWQIFLFQISSVHVLLQHTVLFQICVEKQYFFKNIYANLSYQVPCVFLATDDSA